ncbi:MAG: division/cell wall cluster transcriptional repressor MraZ [Proteobacteria bacterium]|nr:division/cell wall cluster transcriptional repressor MraZ [Pseudomonadota bacterium]
MFRGSSSHTCDPKGRLIVPSRFRDVIRASGGDGMIITTGMTHSLSAYTYDGWKVVEERILASRSPNNSSIRRFFLGNAQDCACDKQGRILIPKNLRTYGGLDKDIILVGLVDHFEIWALDRWESENQQTISALQSGEFKNELADLGL